MHYPTVHPLLDPRTRATLEAELDVGISSGKLELPDRVPKPELGNQ